MKTMIVTDLNDPNKLKIEHRTHKPPNYICEAPKVNGEYVKDIDTIVINDVLINEDYPDMGTKKEASVDPDLKSAKDAANSQAAEDQKWDSMRAERDRRLAATDYIMMSDYPMADKSAVEAYRQALRDLPSNILDIEDFSWPTSP